MASSNGSGDINTNGGFNEISPITITNAEDAFKNIFNSCDEGNTGSAPVSKIIDFMTPWMPQEINKLLKLKKILDPNEEDPNISLRKFCDGMQYWTDNFQSLAELSANNNDHIFGTPCQIENPVLKLPQSTPVCGNKLEKKSKNLFNVTSMSSSASSELAMEDVINLQEKLKEMHFQNSNLQKEFSSLQNELSAAEEQIVNLQNELKTLTRKLQGEQEINKQLQYQCEKIDEFKETANLALKQVEELHRNVALIKNEKGQLEELLSESDTQKHKYEDKIERLHYKLKEKEKMIADMKTEIDVRYHENLALESINKDLKATMNENKSIQEHLMIENEQLKTEKQTLQSKFKEQLKARTEALLSQKYPFLPPGSEGIFNKYMLDRSSPIYKIKSTQSFSAPSFSSFVDSASYKTVFDFNSSDLLHKLRSPVTPTFSPVNNSSFISKTNCNKNPLNFTNISEINSPLADDKSDVENYKSIDSNVSLDPTVPPAIHSLRKEELLNYSYSGSDLGEELQLENFNQCDSIFNEIIIAEQNDSQEIPCLLTEKFKRQTSSEDHSNCEEIISNYKQNIELMKKQYETYENNLKDFLESKMKTGDDYKSKYHQIKQQYENLLVEKDFVELKLNQARLEKESTEFEKTKEIHLATEKISTIENENNKLRNHGETLEIKIKTYKDRIRSLENEIQVLKLNLDKAKMESDTKVHDLEKQYLAEIYAKSTEMEKLSIECDLLKTQLNCMSSKEADYIDNLTSYQKREENLLKDIHQLQERTDAEKVELLKQLECLQIEKQILNDECSTMQLSLHKELARVVKDLENTKEKLTIKTREEENLRIELVEQQTKLYELNRELEILKFNKLNEIEVGKSLKLMSSESELYKKENISLQSELNVCRNELTDCISTINNLNETNLQLQTEIVEMKTSTKKVTDELKNLNKRCAELTLEIGNLSSQKNELEKELNHIRSNDYDINKNEDTSKDNPALHSSKPIVNRKSMYKSTANQKPVNNIEKWKIRLNKLQDELLDVQENKEKLEKKLTNMLNEKAECERKLVNVQQECVMEKQELLQAYEKTKDEIAKLKTKLKFERTKNSDLKLDLKNSENGLADYREYQESVEGHMRWVKRRLDDLSQQLFRIQRYASNIWQMDLSYTQNKRLFDAISYGENELEYLTCYQGVLDMELTDIAEHTKVSCVLLLKLCELRQQELARTPPKPDCYSIADSLLNGFSDRDDESSEGPENLKVLEMHEIMAPATQLLSETCSSSNGNDDVFRTVSGNVQEGLFRHRSPSDSSSTNTTDTSEETDTANAIHERRDVLSEGAAGEDQDANKIVELQGRKFRSMSDGATEINEELFPSLPDELLEKWNRIDEMSEEEIERKYCTLALSFTIDSQTVKDRRARQQRQRDQTEDNMASEINKLIDQIYQIKPLCVDAEKTELLQALLNQVDVIVYASGHVSTSVERFGAVQQEDKLSEAVKLMIRHVENLKKQRDNIKKQLECTKRMLQNYTSDATDPCNGRASLTPNLNGRLIQKRRASIAVITDPKDRKTPSRVTRRTSDLSPRRIEMSDRYERVRSNSRPSRFEDLNKIREGINETCSSSDVFEVENISSSEDTPNTAPAVVEAPVPEDIMATLENNSILYIFKEAGQKYLLQAIEKLRHNYPMLARITNNINYGKVIKYSLYMLLIFTLVSLIFDKDNFLDLLDRIFVFCGPWRYQPR